MTGTSRRARPRNVPAPTPEASALPCNCALLPIGVAVAFGLSGALNLVVSARSAALLETLRSVDNPHLERILSTERGVEQLRSTLQAAAAEGDAGKLDEARASIAAVQQTLARAAALPGKQESVAALSAAFDAYQSAATAATGSLLTKTEAGEHLVRMQVALRRLETDLAAQEQAARAELEAHFAAVADAHRLGQWASALTALAVLAGLGLGSRMLVRSIWRELQAAQNKLLAAARVAGMAEIATNVLHNVGNVLNSVSVSAGLIGAQQHGSKVGGLARVVGLLDANAADLGRYITVDPKGRLLPDYLRGLATTLEGERRDMLAELGELGKSIEHIKEIVAAQQAYAGASRSVESLDLAQLMDDALRLNAQALTRHHISVVKQLAPLPALMLDRHRCLQILVNLISNAKHAMGGVEDRTHCITIGAELAAPGLLRITVADNGVGIAPENLTRVFSHGFTTRKDGHGFGLHSCVIAAQEMGGTLSAHSDGAGQGATFSLEIPVGNPEPRP